MSSRSLILYRYVFFFLIISGNSNAQKTVEELEQFIKEAPFFDSEKRDSLLIWSENIGQIPNSPRAAAYSIRLKGLHEEFEENIPEATDYFLQFLSKTKTYGNSDDQMSAIGDLVYVYITTKQYKAAKGLLSTFINKSDTEKLNQRKLSIFYNNLGICFNNLGKLDSAVIVYQKALLIKERLRDEKGVANLRINMSNLLIKQNRFQEAYKLTKANLDFLKKTKNKQDLFYNLVNMGGILNGLKKYQECEEYLLAALKEAEKSGSADKQKQSHHALAVFYDEINQPKKAFQALVKSNEFSDKLINESTNAKVAELTESYNAKQRSLENNLLTTELKTIKTRQIAYLTGIIALMLLSSFIAWFYYKNRQKNRLIAAQNNSLIQLNTEKNTLMSIVTHDLSNPFSAIKIWAQRISLSENLIEAKALSEQINQTAVDGLKSIKNILLIDKNEIKDIELTEVNLSDLLRTLIGQFETISKEKAIEIEVEVKQNREQILTDGEMLYRALENLLSNALKFSFQNSKILFTTFEDNGMLHFKIKDFGQGIPKTEQHRLFSQYGQTSIKPTKDEGSNGLGLFIVKRLSEELGGKVNVKSTEGIGSKFTLSIPVT